MKAILCTELTGPDGLAVADLPDPSAGPGQVMVGIRTCGLLLVKNVLAVGLYWGGYAKRNPQVLTDSLAPLFAWQTPGKLKPHISATFPLAKTGEAMRSLMERRSRGKVVVTTS